MLGLRLLAPDQSATSTATANPVVLAEFAWMVLVPTALLTLLGLGWWGVAGFTRRSTWRNLVPILLFDVPLLLMLLFGVAGHRLGYFILVAVSGLAVGFGDEATFRGVVLQLVRRPS